MNILKRMYNFQRIIFYLIHSKTPFHQISNSTQSKLLLLALSQKIYLYTCKNIATKPNLDEFLRELFKQYRIENCGKQN